MEPIEDDSGEDELPPSAPADSESKSDPLLRQLGEVIRAGRRKKGLSQSRAAQRLNVSVETLKRAERGGNPTFRMFFTIIRGLGIRPFELEGYVIGKKEDLESAGGGKKRTQVPPIKRDEVPLRPKTDDSSVKPVEVVSRHEPKTTPVRLHAEIRGGQLVTLRDGDVVMLPEDIPLGGTIQVRVAGEDYTDVLSVIRSGPEAPRPGARVIAIINGEAVIGRYWPVDDERRLIPESGGRPITLSESDQIYGVIKTLVRRYKDE